LSHSNECGLTISLLKQSNDRRLKLQPAVETQHYERAWLKGQLTRICRFTGRPGKASTPKNTGRKTQKRSELPSIFVSVRKHPDRMFSTTYDRF
jgi:hypothetical protein